MEFFQKNKKILLFVGIFALVIIIYLIFFSGGSSTPAGVSYDPSSGGLVSEVSSSPVDEIVGRDLLLMLSRLKSIFLDTTIFADEAFKSLDDKSRPIDAQPFGKALGRRNPFSEFGKGGSTASAPLSTSTSAFGGN